VITFESTNIETKADTTSANQNILTIAGNLNIKTITQSMLITGVLRRINDQWRLFITIPIVLDKFEISKLSPDSNESTFELALHILGESAKL
jgi:hypothetical protein